MATVCGSRTEETCMWGTDPFPAHPAWEGVHHCRQGLGAGTWGVESRPRQRTAVDCEETSWGDGRGAGRSSINGMLVEEAWTTTEQSTIVEWCPKGRTPLQPLSPCAGPSFLALGRAATRVGSNEPQPWPPPCTSSTISRPLCSEAATGADTYEWATDTNGAESTAEPQG